MAPPLGCARQVLHYKSCVVIAQFGLVPQRCYFDFNFRNPSWKPLQRSTIWQTMVPTVQRSEDKRGSTLASVLAQPKRLLTLTCQRLRRKRFALLRFVLLFILLWSWILYFVLAYIIPVTPALVPVSLLVSTRPLLIVAHPDDESLFFGPTILSITQAKHKSMSVLVLSSGTR